ncbi:hypothetical protein GCM10028771_07410 [Nocardioides marmoraquaticus]
MQAGAADLVALHERDAQAELRGAQRARVTARPGTQHHEVVLTPGTLRHAATSLVYVSVGYPTTTAASTGPRVVTRR